MVTLLTLFAQPHVALQANFNMRKVHQIVMTTKSNEVVTVRYLYNNLELGKWNFQSEFDILSPTETFDQSAQLISNHHVKVEVYGEE